MHGAAAGSDRTKVDATPTDLEAPGIAPKRRLGAATVLLLLVCCALVLAMAGVIAWLAATRGGSGERACQLSGSSAGPHDRTGQPIPQALQNQSGGCDNVMLSGNWWEPMELPASSAASPAPIKGALRPETTAMVIIDMQPLFYDTDSPWGVTPAADCPSGGLPCSIMSDIWEPQLRVARRVAAMTGRNDSIFLTRYVTPPNASAATGIMRHYYGITPGWANERAATRDALQAQCDKIGCDVDALLGVMPELGELVAAGATVADKRTGGAFGPGSELPALVQAYFGAPAPHLDPWRTLIVAGVETDYCVISTVLGAIDEYFRIIILTDGIGSSQPNAAQAQLDYTLRRFDHMVDFASSEDLLTYLG